MMVKKLYSRIFIAALAASSSVNSQAQVERRYSRTFNQCMAQSDGGDASIVDCTSAEIEWQDGRLNQAYAMVMKRLPLPRQTSLRQSERVWIKQRDAVCARQAKPEAGGTLYNVVYGRCILDETIKRTMFLERYQ